MLLRLDWRLLVAVLAVAARPRAAPAGGADGSEPQEESEAAARGIAGGCLGEACTEELVERSEQPLIDAMNVELLQRNLQLKPQAVSRDSLETGGVARDSADREDAVRLQDVEDAHRDRASSGASTVDCKRYPMFCNPKLNCADKPLTPAERLDLKQRLASEGGHANLRAWCYGYPMYAQSVQKCIVEEDPQGYAHAMYESQTQLNLLNADAAYCFAVGHCNNTALGENSTHLEAEAVCDQQFGHERWTSIGWKDMDQVMKVAFAYTSGEVVTRPATWEDKVALVKNLSTVSAMTGCSMGNFQCDVAYCKLYYCHNATYRAKFSNLSWA